MGERTAIRWQFLGLWIVIAGCAGKCDMQVPGGVSNMCYLQLQDMGLV